MEEGNFWKDNLRGRGNSPISPLPSIFPPSLFAFPPSFLSSSSLPLLAWCYGLHSMEKLREWETGKYGHQDGLVWVMKPHKIPRAASNSRPKRTEWTWQSPKEFHFAAGNHGTACVCEQGMFSSASRHPKLKDYASAQEWTDRPTGFLSWLSIMCSVAGWETRETWVSTQASEFSRKPWPCVFSVLC